MKIYIAARYDRKAEVAAITARLASVGHLVTSTWHLEPHPANIQITDLAHDDLRLYAARNLQEIRISDVLLFLAEPLDGMAKRGGRHVEFGYALGLGKSIAVIGPLENIFHHLVGVYRHVDLASFIKEGNDGPDKS